MILRDLLQQLLGNALQARSSAPAQPSQGLPMGAAPRYTLPPVSQGSGLQPHMPATEDSYTPRDALENTGYYNPQTTLNGAYNQNPQPWSLRNLLGF